MNSDEYERGRRSAIVDLFKLLEVEGGDFYHNQSNNYGCVTFKWFCGAGDPWVRFKGAETQADYSDGRRGTGRYSLNAEAVEAMLSEINSLPEER